MSAKPHVSHQKMTFYSYLGISSDPYFYWLVVAYSLIAILNVALPVFGYADMYSLKLTCRNFSRQKFRVLGSTINV